jgi:hypothetical protein
MLTIITIASALAGLAGVVLVTLNPGLGFALMLFGGLLAIISGRMSNAKVP